MGPRGLYPLETFICSYLLLSSLSLRPLSSPSASLGQVRLHRLLFGEPSPPRAALNLRPVLSVIRFLAGNSTLRHWEIFLF